MTAVTVVRATLRHLPELELLFEAYLEFYGRASAEGAAGKFLHGRLAAGESLLLLANVEDEAVGFVQLYPSFSSLALSRTMILNDLFVVPAWRGRGIASALLASAEKESAAQGAASMGLMTSRTNCAARKLYEARGWVEETEFINYELKL